MRTGIVGVLVALFALAALGDRDGELTPSPASAGGATIVVTTLEDAIFGTDCSLRMAISNANSDDDLFPSASPGPGPIRSSSTSRAQSSWCMISSRSRILPD